MNKKDSHDRHEATELAAFRQQIDEIDDRIAHLLVERIGIVGRVGELKRRTAPGRCPIRPAREAEMIRRVIEKFQDSPFMPAAAAAIWRTLIGASTSAEAPLVLSVFTPDRDNDLFWISREYFGSFLPIIRQPHIKRVIGDVMDGKASVGIVPMLRSADTTFWWTNLTQQSHDVPRVFARLPFVNLGTPSRDAPAALAIARIAPEPSGDDQSLIVLEVDHNVSQQRLQAAFNIANIPATWINIATLSTHARHHLIEIKGFVTHENEALQTLLTSFGTSIFNVSFLGAYAVPITLNANHIQEFRPGLHVAASTKK